MATNKGQKAPPVEDVFDRKTPICYTVLWAVLTSVTSGPGVNTKVPFRDPLFSFSNENKESRNGTFVDTFCAGAMIYALLLIFRLF